MRRLPIALLILCLLALLNGCSLFMPAEKVAYQVCAAPKLSWAYNPTHTDSIPIWIKACWTEWRSPGIDSTTAEGAADLEITDRVLQVSR